MTWLWVVGVVAFVLATLGWLFMGAATEGIGTDGEWNWRRQLEGWWLWLAMFVVFFGVCTAVYWAWQGVVGLWGVLWGS